MIASAFLKGVRIANVLVLAVVYLLFILFNFYSVHPTSRLWANHICWDYKNILQGCQMSNTQKCNNVSYPAWAASQNVLRHMWQSSSWQRHSQHISDAHSIGYSVLYFLKLEGQKEGLYEGVFCQQMSQRNDCWQKSFRYQGKKSWIWRSGLYITGICHQIW